MRATARRGEKAGDTPAVGTRPIDGFTGDQRFFLAWSQLWCSRVLPDEQRRRMLVDNHSAGPFRDGRGRIYLTGKLIPPIHSGGNNGWWEFDELAMGPDKITARYRLNGMNKPRVAIDRRTGRVTIDGIEKFRGECDQGNWGDRGNRF